MLAPIQYILLIAKCLGLLEDVGWVWIFAPGILGLFCHLFDWGYTRYRFSSGEKNMNKRLWAELDVVVKENKKLREENEELKKATTP